MSGFVTPLLVELDDSGLWILAEDLIWQGSQRDTLVVPAGEETDFASVPRWLQGIMPATGTWTRAAVVHDMLCRLQNEHRQRVLAWVREFNDWLDGPDDVEPTFGEFPDDPAFNSVDTDAVFRKIMKADGTSWIMRQVGWVGVRWGALFNPARRAGWLSTAPAVLGLSTAFLAGALAILVGLGAAVSVVLS